jgi:hypothetical protein
LSSTYKMLGEKGTLSGPIVGNVPDRVSAFINPDAISAREAVEEVVQRSLREILGAQFTEKEGERLIARAYNPKLQESENRLRVGRLLAQVMAAADAKEDAFRYFEQHGTMQGWTGKEYKNEDFDPDNLFDGKGGAPTAFEPQDRAEIVKFLMSGDRSPDELVEFARNLRPGMTIGNPERAVQEVPPYLRGGGDPEQIKWEPAGQVQAGGDWEILGFEDE